MRREPLRALGLAALLSCGGPQTQAGQGGVCFRTDDCRVGLACVPAAPGSMKRVCSSDLSGIVSMVEPPPAAAPEPASDPVVEKDGGAMPGPAGGGTGDAGATPTGASGGADNALPTGGGMGGG